MDDETQVAFRERIRAYQLQAHYPSLLSDRWRNSSGVLIRRLRPRAQLITVAVRHDALSEEQLDLLGEFRLHQFVLCGWYDVDKIVARRIETDLALSPLPPDSIHVLVGTAEGRILAYTCLQTASYTDVETNRRVTSSPFLAPTPRKLHYLTDAVRPQFPTERDLVGTHLFASLPALRDIPVEHILGWECSFRNQAIQSPLGVAALYEAFNAPFQLVLDPVLNIRAVLSDNNIDARKVCLQLGIPALYAPRVPVAPPSDDSIWTPQVNVPGQFWPGVMASADLAEQTEYLERVEEALSFPPHEIRRQLVRALNHTTLPRPRVLMPEPGETSVLWTADPFFGMDAPDVLKPRVRQPATVGARQLA